MLTARELAEMRAVQAETLTDTATVTRRAYAADGLGGQTETTTAATLPCRVAPALFERDGAMVGGQVREIAQWRITFAAGADVRKDDRVAVSGAVYEVLAVYGPETRETARVVLAEER